MLDSILEFWRSNSANIIVSLIVGFLFFVLGPLGLWFSGRKIRRERIRKAKDSLLDLLEGMVVNQAPTGERKLRSVFRAVEREIDIDLSGEYSLDQWLGDVVLRFEKSRHLGADQKQKYYEAVERIAEDIREKKEQELKPVVPRKYEAIVGELRSAIDSNDQAKATTALNELEQNLNERPKSQDPLFNVFRIYYRLYQRTPVTFTFASIVVVALYVYFFRRFLLVP